MITTRKMLRDWFQEGVSQGSRWMIIKVDDFDYEDYPVFVEDDAKKFDEAYFGGDRVMESYDLDADMDEQLAEFRCHRRPS